MKLLLVDDHPIVHVGLGHLLADFVPPVQLQALPGVQGVAQALQGEPPDLVLLDLQLGGEDGFACLQSLRATHPELPVVVLSERDERAEVIRAIDEGAMGFIPKNSPPEVFRRALHLVVLGGIYVPPTAQDEGSTEGGAAPRSPGLARDPEQALARVPVTPRQREVLHGLLQGKPNKLIAVEMGISAETVKDHVAAVYRALQVNNRTQAVMAVARLG